MRLSMYNIGFWIFANILFPHQMCNAVSEAITENTLAYITWTECLMTFRAWKRFQYACVQCCVFNSRIIFYNLNMNVNSIEFRTVIYFHHNRRQRGASFGQSESNESAAACVCVCLMCVYNTKSQMRWSNNGSCINRIYIYTINVPHSIWQIYWSTEQLITFLFLSAIDTQINLHIIFFHRFFSWYRI